MKWRYTITEVRTREVVLGTPMPDMSTDPFDSDTVTPQQVMAAVEEQCDARGIQWSDVTRTLTVTAAQ